MSICTKTGDQGTTGLMYNRRVSKTHPRIETFGNIDELNASLGVARAAATTDFVREKLLTIQKDLVNLMGELAVQKDDLSRYINDGFKVITPEEIDLLEKWINEIEAQKISFKGWATPGATTEAAALDLARTVARRAERSVQALLEFNVIENRLLQIYLNRTSDLLWLIARWVETNSNKTSL